MTATAPDWAGHGGTATAERYLRFAEQAARLSPSYAVLSRGVAADPVVLERLDELPPAKRQPNLLFGAVRWHGGPVDTYPGFRSFVLSGWDELSSTMRQRRTQTNEPRRLATLLPALADVQQPLALLEIGASAGLCLYPDRYAYRYDDGPVRGASALVLRCATEGAVPLPLVPPAVGWRGGIDLNPLDVASDEDVRWLEALIWPEESERFAVLHEAVAIARREPATIVAGDLTRDLVALAAGVPSDCMLVVFHSAVLAYVDEAGRSALRSQLAELAASRPVVWLANEAPDVVVPADRVPAVERTEFVLSRDGEPLAFTESHGTHLRWLAPPSPESLR